MQKSKNLGYPLLKLLILLIGAIIRRRLATLAELATPILNFHLAQIDLSVSRRFPAQGGNQRVRFPVGLPTLKYLA